MAGERKTIVEQLQTAWPMIMAAVALAALMVSMQSDLRYIQRDLHTLSEQVRRKMLDRYTGKQHADYDALNIVPLKERVRLLEISDAARNGIVD